MYYVVAKELECVMTEELFDVRFEPVWKLSTHTTSCPSEMSASQRCERDKTRAPRRRGYASRMPPACPALP